jgi:group I intron endonuclease
MGKTIYSGIYIFTNKNNRKKYIGKSKNLFSRIRGYKSVADGRSKGMGIGIFERALKKHGWNGFTLQLFELAEGKLDEYEKALIFLFDTTDIKLGYNLTYGGSETKYTDYARNKISTNRLAKTAEARKEKEIIKRFKILLNKAKAELQRRYRLKKEEDEALYRLSDEYAEAKRLKKLNTSLKLSLLLKGKKKKSYAKRIEPIHICPHCGLEGKGNAMLQHHFDKCRYKIKPGILIY